MPAIRTDKLSRHFGEKVAVDGINLSVEPGEIYGFLGPNGAGKTTTIRMLVTLLAPTSGDAWVMGYSVRDDPAAVRLRIGVAMQQAAIDDQQTGAELLRLQGRLYGLRSSEIERRLSELRELVDIGPDFDKRIKTYSGGMKRRIDLAAALVHEPSVLFLDEPTTGLDPANRRKVWEEIRRLNQELGITILLTTQYLEEADQLAGRVGIISDGRIVAEGRPADLKRGVGTDVVVVQLHEEAAVDRAVSQLRTVDGVERVEAHNREVTVSTAAGPRLVSRVALALDEAGVAVDELTLRTPTLDDVFLEATGTRLRKGNNGGGNQQ